MSLNVVDSSAWLEYFADTPRAKLFAAAIEDTVNLVVPVVVLYEVCNKVRRERGEDAVLQVAAAMESGLLIEVDARLALDASRLDLPLADSLIYATALRHGATLWTQGRRLCRHGWSPLLQEIADGAVCSSNTMPGDCCITLKVSTVSWVCVSTPQPGLAATKASPKPARRWLMVAGAMRIVNLPAAVRALLSGVSNLVVIRAICAQVDDLKPICEFRDA